MKSCNGTEYPIGTIYTTKNNCKWELVEDLPTDQYKCRHISDMDGIPSNGIMVFNQSSCSLYRETCKSIELPKNKNFKILYDKLR